MQTDPKGENPSSFNIAALGLRSVAYALVRHPILPLIGLVVALIAAIVDKDITTASAPITPVLLYIPFLAGGWAVLCHLTPNKHGRFPTRKQLFRFAMTCLCVAVLASIANGIIPYIGYYVVVVILALAPTVALAGQLWPPGALWRSVLIIEQSPRDFGFVFAASTIMSVAFFILGFFILYVLGFNPSSYQRHLLLGLSKGVWLLLLSALWMNYYLTTWVPEEETTTRKS